MPDKPPAAIRRLDSLRQVAWVPFAVSQTTPFSLREAASHTGTLR